MNVHNFKSVQVCMGSKKKENEWNKLNKIVPG